MYKIRYSKDFKKSLKKLQKSGKFGQQTREKLTLAINSLAAGEKLPEGYRDHKLKGVFSDKRECHIKGDLLLVYKKEEELLILVMVDVGTHSQIFG